MTVDDSSLRNVFFLGAGASVNAGVSTTFGLVEEFDTFLADQDKLSKTLHEILSILRQDGHKVDIEELLQTIDRLENREEDSLVKFYETKGFKLKNSELLSQLRAELKNFINKSTSIREDKVRYLEPLFSYPKPVLVFSVNYDTAIEQLCNVYKKTYTDGFDYLWNQKLFQNNKLDFHVYKLHGSIMWYKADKGDYLKLPLPPKEGKIELIFGDEAHHLMLYPMQKWEFDEPLLEMMQQFRSYLEKTEAVIVVGYSFRDPYMVKIFHDAARKNRKLFVVLICPNAREIYENKLRYYFIEDKKSSVPSSLENRVLCLQYKFEDILPIISNFSNDARGGFLTEETSVENSYSGGNTNWYFNGGPLEYFIKSEFIDRADPLFKKINWSERITDDPFRIVLDSFKMFLVAEEHNIQSYIDWLKLFLKASSLISTVKLEISVDFSTERVSYLFKTDPTSGRPFSALQNSLEQIIEFYRRKRENIPKNSLSDDLITRLIMLSNFVRFRSSNEQKFDIVAENADGNNYKDIEYDGYSKALADQKKFHDDTTWKNLVSFFKILEIQRLSEILGDNTFKEYLEETLRKDEQHGYQKYAEALK